MVDMALLVLLAFAFHIYRRVGWSQSSPLKIFFACSLSGGGRYGAELKVTDGAQSAVSCVFLRKSAASCENRRSV